ncbi:MAG: hypothetical protein KGL39_07420 [Patescibacteria group bacterium]|nr:hypothetical protein [Patescibacteria group bacterium]
MTLVQAFRLAELIEAVHAKERVKVSRVRNARWQDQYDPLAATCLAELIYDVSTGKTKI